MAPRNYKEENYRLEPWENIGLRVAEIVEILRGDSRKNRWIYM